MSALTRKRLDVPEVHAILAACDRLMRDYAETDDGSPERADLFGFLSRASEELEQAAYGGPTIATSLSYWLRPYDARLDARVWRWNRPDPCKVIYL